MRLKSFTAKTMKEAMDMVRDTLGEEAVIVATREEKNAVGSAIFHITAAVEKDLTANYQDYPAHDWNDLEDEDESSVIEDLTDNMLRHAVPEEVLHQVISCASVLGIDEPRLALLSAIERLFKFNPIPSEKLPLPLMMLGPPGAGKTLATAKLAARSAMNGLNVAVITTDIERAGGREQLEAFTRLMDIELKTAKSPTELKEVILSVKDADQILIDTAGINPFDTNHIKKTAQLIGAVELDSVFVLPANTNADEAGEMAQIFATMGTKRLLPTRVDVARRLGSLMAAAYQGSLSFTEVSTTAKVADGLSHLTSKRLTQLLMPHAKTVTMPVDKKVYS